MIQIDSRSRRPSDEILSTTRGLNLEHAVPQCEAASPNPTSPIVIEDVTCDVTDTTTVRAIAS